jgi:hypothetical protein
MNPGVAPPPLLHQAPARSKKSRWMLAGALGIVIVLFVFDPSHTPIFPVCLFHRVTGLDCPGCGSLRAMHALLHGQWATAIGYNGMLILSLPLLVMVSFRWIGARLGVLSQMTIRPLWFWIYGAAWIVFGILRNLPLEFFKSWAA